MQDKINESILGVVGVGYDGRKTHSEVYAGIKRAGVVLDHIDLARRVDALVAAGDLWQLEFEEDQVFSFCRPTPPIADEDDRRYSDVVERQRIAEFLATVVVGEDWVEAHDIAEYVFRRLRENRERPEVEAWVRAGGSEDDTPEGGRGE